MMRLFLLLLFVVHALAPVHTPIVVQAARLPEGDWASTNALQLEMLALRSRTARVGPISSSKATAGVFTPGLVCTRDIYDSFSEQTLAPEWTWTDPNNDVLATLGSRAGYLRLSTNAANNNLNPAGNLNGPRLLRPLATTTGIIRTGVSINAEYDFQGAGLLVWHDAANFAWLHRALGVNGAGIYYAVAVSNVMTYTMVAATPNDVELQITIRDGVINGYWRSGTDSWQFVGGGVLTGSLSGGVNLVADFNSPGILADFAYFESETCKAAGNLSYLPVVGKADTAIRGAVTLNGIPAEGVEVLLRQYRPGDTNTPPTTIATAVTAVNGTYRFENPPDSPNGYARYVLFRNPNQNSDGRLIAFVGDNLPPTGGVAVAPIEIADIPLGAPFDPQYVVDVVTPIQFNWQRRIASPDDSYRLWLEAPSGSPSFASAHLGFAGSYILQSRPAGFAPNPSYYLWYVSADTAAGMAFSYSAGAVAFNN